MKKGIALLLSALVFFFAFWPVGAIAAPVGETETGPAGESEGTLVSGVGAPLLPEQTDNEAVSAFQDILRFFRRLFYLFTGVKTVEGSKYLRYYDKNGVLLWEATLTAEFSYSKRQARCESARLSFISLDPDWAIVSRRTEKTDAEARGFIAVRQTKLGVPLQTIERTLTLSCDTAGRLS